MSRHTCVVGRTYFGEQRWHNTLFKGWKTVIANKAVRFAQ